MGDFLNKQFLIHVNIIAETYKTVSSNGIQSKNWELVNAATFFTYLTKKYF